MYKFIILLAALSLGTVSLSHAQIEENGTFDIVSETLNNTDGVWSGPATVVGELDGGTTIDRDAKLVITVSPTNPTKVDYQLYFEDGVFGEVLILSMDDDMPADHKINLTGISGKFIYAQDN